MKENDKIYVSKFLENLNERVKQAKRHGFNDKYIKYINCKDIASECEVTPCTISNLNTNSKFSLIYKIADYIYDCYYSYYNYEYQQQKNEYPDEDIYIRDRNYIMYELTNYWTDEWFNY